MPRYGVVTLLSVITYRHRINNRTGYSPIIRRIFGVEIDRDCQNSFINIIYTICCQDTDFPESKMHRLIAI